jgi:hypothetical protein
MRRPAPRLTFAPPPPPPRRPPAAGGPAPWAQRRLGSADTQDILDELSGLSWVSELRL